MAPHPMRCRQFPPERPALMLAEGSRKQGAFPSRVALTLMPCPRFPNEAALFSQPAAASQAQLPAQYPCPRCAALGSHLRRPLVPAGGSSRLRTQAVGCRAWAAAQPAWEGPHHCHRLPAGQGAPEERRGAAQAAGGGVQAAPAGLWGWWTLKPLFGLQGVLHQL